MVKQNNQEEKCEVECKVPQVLNLKSKLFAGMHVPLANMSPSIMETSHSIDGLDIWIKCGIRKRFRFAAYIFTCAMIKFFMKKMRMPQKNHVEPNGAVGLFGVKSERRLDQKFWLKMPKKPQVQHFPPHFYWKMPKYMDLLAFWNCQKRPFSGQKSPIYRDLSIQGFAPKSGTPRVRIAPGTP